MCIRDSFLAGCYSEIVYSLSFLLEMPNFITGEDSREEGSSDPTDIMTIAVDSAWHGEQNELSLVLRRCLEGTKLQNTCQPTPKLIIESEKRWI